VHEAEYRHVETLREPQRFWVPADFELLREVKPPTLVAGDEELMRGVRLVHLPGHSPGSMALLVKLDHPGWVVLTGDALYTHDSYGPPAGSPMNPTLSAGSPRWRSFARSPASMTSSSFLATAKPASVITTIRPTSRWPRPPGSSTNSRREPSRATM
jgi:hypothetical protein